MTPTYKSDLELEQKKLHGLLIDLEVLQAQIAKQKRRVAALTELADNDEESPAPAGLVTGITDAVRTVFMGAEKPLNPAQVRDRVKALGVGNQQNLLASVHTIIRRLLVSKEIELVGDVDFGGGYRWKRLSFGQKIAAGTQADDFKPKLGDPNPTNTQSRKK